MSSEKQDRGDVTALLRRWTGGDQAALNQLAPLVEQRLNQLARARLREGFGHSLQPTELVNEAFARLIEANVDFQNRAHFLAVAATLIRRILVDRARARMSEKRGGDQVAVTLDPEALGAPGPALDVLDLETALLRLGEEDARKAKIIEMHYYGGMTFDEIAAASQVSRVTVHRDLTMARAWLLNQLDRSP